MNQEGQETGGHGAAGGVESEVIHIVDQHLQHARLVVGQVDEFGAVFLRPMG